MLYKGDYSPSYLLDPDDYTWAPLDTCRSLLDKYHYACFTHPERSRCIPAVFPGTFPHSLYVINSYSRLVAFTDPTPEIPREVLQNAQHVVRGERAQVAAPIVVSLYVHVPTGEWHS